MTITKHSLKQCEAIIDKAKEHFYHAGIALGEIRDDKKYKEAGFSSFESYLDQRWGYTPSWASLTIAAAQTRKLLPDLKSVDGRQHSAEWGEWAVRPLTKVKNDHGGAVVRKIGNEVKKQVEKIAAEDPGKKIPLAPLVKEATAKVVGTPAKKPKPKPAPTYTPELPDLRTWVIRTSSQIDDICDKLATVTPKEWNDFAKSEKPAYSLRAAASRLMEYTEADA